MFVEASTARYVVDASHPALAGHFPGDPIVPAAILLRFVARTLEQRGRQLAAVERMKFLRPVRPGEAIDVTMTPTSDDRGRVEITIAGKSVARGEWQSTQG
jgi:3-hydroxymyristoyl/3-hydroxydecanoyl-(acyl carrier protein) dehydratase